MKTSEEKRRRWAPVIARFERSGKSQAEFTTEAGIGIAGFRYWLYRLRREREGSEVAGGAKSGDEVRLVPISVRRPVATGRLDLRTGSLRVLMPIGTDPRYVAQVAAALRDGASC